MAEIKLNLSSELEEEIKEMFKRSAREVFYEMSKHSINTRDYLNLKEACNYLNIANGTLSLWIREYQLPVVKIAGKKFISKESLVEFMKKHEEKI